LKFPIAISSPNNFNISRKIQDDGQNCALVSNDNLVQYLSVGGLDKPGLAFNNHKEKVNSVDISHDCRLLLSASEDKTCKLWSLKKSGELLLDIQSIKVNDSSVNILANLAYACINNSL
jgi:WD40 repeat protein